MEVGVRELKQQLSRYLDRVAAGEEITVTDRGRAKARLVPIVEQGLLQQGIDDGWIRPAVRAGSVGQHRRLRSDHSTTDLLDQDRGR
jgi:prevent-host-death family protein